MLVEGPLSRIRPDLRRVWAARIVPIAVMLGLTVACGVASDPEPAAPEHVFLIVFDTLRADRLGSYGHDRETSPNLDRLARDGSLFASAVSLSSWTKPSTATLLTSLSPSTHRVGTFDSVIPEAATTLAERLAEAGFETLGFSANIFVSEKFGFGQGFHELHSLGSENAVDSQSPLAYRMALDAVDPSRKQFFYLHLIGPHGPYCPTPEHKRKFVAVGNPKLDRRQCGGGQWYRAESSEELQYLRDLYDAEISEEDAYFGEFLDRLDSLEFATEPLVVFTSDHGEAFREHRRMEHGNNLFNEEIRVPLIFRGPGVPVARHAAIVGLHDVAPTILSLAGLEIPDAFEGVDVSAPIPHGRAIPLHEFQEVAKDREYLGIIAGGVKAFWDSERTEEHLYLDWRADSPDRNLAAERPELLERLIEQLTSDRRSEIGGESTELDQETRRKLKALGYL